VKSCLIDGEAILCDDNGLAVFQLLRNYRNGHAATLCAFDLIEIEGEGVKRLEGADCAIARPWIRCRRQDLGRNIVPCPALSPTLWHRLEVPS
jgi:hypothetical protein